MTVAFIVDMLKHNFPPVWQPATGQKRKSRKEVSVDAKRVKMQDGESEFELDISCSSTQHSQLLTVHGILIDQDKKHLDKSKPDMSNTCEFTYHEDNGDH